MSILTGDSFCPGNLPLLYIVFHLLVNCFYPRNLRGEDYRQALAVIHGHTGIESELSHGCVGPDSLWRCFRPNALVSVVCVEIHASCPPGFAVVFVGVFFCEALQWWGALSSRHRGLGEFRRPRELVAARSERRGRPPKQNFQLDGYARRLSICVWWLWGSSSDSAIASALGSSAMRAKAAACIAMSSAWTHAKTCALRALWPDLSQEVSEI